MRICRGLTLPELLIVLSIIAFLSVLAFPLYETYLNRSGIVPALSELYLLQQRADAYIAYNGRCLVSEANRTSFPESRFFSGYVFTKDPTNATQCLVKAQFKSTVQSPDFKNKIIYMRRMSESLWICQVSISVPLTQTDCTYTAGLTMAL